MCDGGCDAELRKVVILAIQDRGTLWESGEHVDQIAMFFLFFFICRNLRTFETIFRLSVGTFKT